MSTHQQKFFNACANGDLNRAIETYERGKVDINATSNYGVTPFMIACRFGHMAVAEWIFETAQQIGDPVDLNKKDQLNDNAFTKACTQKDYDIAKWIHSIAVEHGQELTYTHSTTRFLLISALQEP